MKDYSKEFLQSNKFKYRTNLSDNNDEMYTYRFPVIFYNKIPTTECEIVVSSSVRTVTINVYNSGTKELYSSY